MSGHGSVSRIKDETYVIDLCDRLLGEKAERQYRGFPFLVGDAGTRLPVDAYYPGRDLVIEYHERQHTEPVAHFDKPWKQTVSGVSRGEQRRRYDELRRVKLAENHVKLIELSYKNFKHNARKRLLRFEKDDFEVLRESLAAFL